MSCEDGSMRMMPGWTQVEGYNEQIGRRMPYARKVTNVQIDEQANSWLWSEDTASSKQVILESSVLTARSGIKSLPLGTPDMLRKTVEPDGSVRSRFKFRPFPVYRFLDVGLTTRTLRSRGKSKWRSGDRVEVLYLLFKVEKIARMGVDGTKPSPNQAVKGMHYVTSLGARYSESSLKRWKDVGLFELRGSKHIWRLSHHCQDVQLFEAYMDKKARGLQPR